MCEFICRGEAAGETAPGKRSGSREDVTPTAAGKGESEDNGDEGDLQSSDRGQAGHPAPADQGSYRLQEWDPGGTLRRA
jgi:hypothetical protein